MAYHLFDGKPIKKNAALTVIYAEKLKWNLWNKLFLFLNALKNDTGKIMTYIYAWPWSPNLTRSSTLSTSWRHTNKEFEAQKGWITEATSF